MRTRSGCTVRTAAALLLLSGDPNGTLLAARAAQEIGADFVKTYYSGDPESFHKVVEGCPVPVVVLGGEKTETVEQVFSLVHASIQAGGKGIAIGRNIWEHGKTKAMSRRWSASSARGGR